MQLSSHTISKIFFSLTVIILLFISYFSYIRIQNLITSQKSVYHTNEVRLELEKILSEIKDAETGQRGFIITSDSVYLSPYIGSKTRVNASLKNLTALVQDNPRQLKSLVVLRKLISMRYETLEKTQVYNVTSNQKEFRKNFLYGKNLMDQIRYELNRMIVTENELLTERNVIKDQFEAVTPRFLLVLTLFSLVLVSGAYFIIKHQLDERIKFQEILENNITELNRSNSELEQFAYVASHDLQEPLRKIQSFGDKLLVKHNEVLNDDGKFLVDRMRTSAERMQGLINDLLSFSRLMQQKNPVREKIVLRKIINNIISDLQLLIEKKKAIIKLHNLPEIMGTPSQIQQLFQNLIANALKFSKPDEAPLIEINSEIVKTQNINEPDFPKQPTSFHKITVKDNGIGFNDQYKEKIFIIFQRLHGKLEYEGTGIGLAVCKKIASNHNGYLTATSILGTGSTFIVYLPVISELKK